MKYSMVLENGINITVNPNNSKLFGNNSIEIMNIINNHILITDFFDQLDSEKDSLNEVWNIYGFGGASTDLRELKVEDGVYKFEGDPELQPLIKYEQNFEGKKEEFYIYDYALTAFLVNGKLVSHGRMD